MSRNPHEIFAAEEDRWSWDKYIEQCDLIELTDDQRQHVKASFQYIRRVLGEGFLHRSYKHDNPNFFFPGVAALPIPQAVVPDF
jgi:hypothetical protein